MNNIVVVTTFPNSSWLIYAEKMLQSFVQFWPKEIPLIVQLDNNELEKQVDAILRPQDHLVIGWTEPHGEFVTRNKPKDDPNNYRFQATRFCHKVFSLDHALSVCKKAGAEGARYIIWLDADVHTTRSISMVDVQECLPKEGDAVSYLGRKDWPHSECGWLAFDLKNRGDDFIETLVAQYISDNIFSMKEWHDSWAFDVVRKSKDAPTCTNLTEDKPGMDIWQHSPMAKWSVHYKGPIAKQSLVQPQPQQSVVGAMGSNIIIQTKNAVSNKQIHLHIIKNQKLIKNWVRECEINDEQIVVVSAGPMLIAEDLLKEQDKKIVAVKHALEPLKQAGVQPWACILLDPRPHMMKFVEKPDTTIKWFVASQVNPKVTKRLLDAGCEVWGYHASVNAEEGFLTSKQLGAVVGGGTATATRGLFLLHHLGFRRFKLYGYDLCYPDKVDLHAKDDIGQPKYLEMSLGQEHPLYRMKRCFWTEPQLIAQLEEMNDILKQNKFDIEAVGAGIVPYIVDIKRVTELRQSNLKGKMRKVSSYKRLMRWKTSSKPTSSLTRLLSSLF